jgi:methanogenic corrinoid protein MtbC1
MARQHPLDPGVARRSVMAAVRELDGVGVRDALLECLLAHGVDVAVAEVVMPVLREVGEGWERGEMGVLHEHFVSSSFRGVLGEMLGPLSGQVSRTVVLACPPGELHDLPLELFGAMLHARSWRVVSLGADTPMTAVADAVRILDADACVLAGVRRSVFESRMPSLTRLGRCAPVFLAGQGAVRLPEPPPMTVVLPPDLRAAADLVDEVARESAAG